MEFFKIGFLLSWSIHAGLSKKVHFHNLSNIDPCTCYFYYSLLGIQSRTNLELKPGRNKVLIQVNS